MNTLDMSLDDIIGRENGARGGIRNVGGGGQRQPRRVNQRKSPYTVRSITGSITGSIPHVSNLGTAPDYMNPGMAGQGVGGFNMFGQPQMMQGVNMGMGMGAVGMQQMQTQSPPPGQVKELRVSSDNNVVKVKQLAGSVFQHIRMSIPLVLLAIGANSVNQAIKALAIAVEALDAEKDDLLCYPELRQMNSSESPSSHGAAMKFQVSKRLNTRSKIGPTSELKVASTSEPRTVAGSIAAKIREGERLSITAIGPQSVCQTVRALAMSRLYLTEDGMDLSFRPEFVHIDSFSDGSRSGIKFDVFAQQI